jgi:hypothetical protein
MKNKTLIKHLLYCHVVEFKTDSLVNFDVPSVINRLKERTEAAIKSITTDILHRVWTGTESTVQRTECKSSEQANTL